MTAWTIMTRTYYVYLLTNWNDTVMYVGMTNDLKSRLFEHKNKLVKGFTAKTIFTSWFILKKRMMCMLPSLVRKKLRSGAERRKIIWFKQ
jgi:hypothetical protein